MKIVIMTLLSISSSLLVFQNASAKSAPLPSASIINAQKINGVYVVKDGEAITLQLSKNFSKRVNGEKWVPASATGFDISMPYSKIPKDAYLPPYMFCSLMIGATDPAEQVVTVVEKKFNATPYEMGQAAAFGGLDEVALGGQSSWLYPDENDRVTLKLDTSRITSFPTEFTINLASRSARVFNFFAKRKDQVSGNFLMPRYVSLSGAEENLIYDCVQPDNFIKVRVEK